ncbi:MAG TPA: hypothetical protein DIW27_10215 [Cytophagales bacterium]|nr:hypothetical protein [Cytophagales bacterium]
MLLDQKGQLWDVDEFEREDELEQLVFENYQLIYGDQSLLFGKKIISTMSGTRTIPDAYIVDLEERQWYLVEVELLHHGVYDHIVPQITKQVNASSNPQMKSVLRQSFLTQIQNNKEYLQLFKDAEIPEIQIADVLDGILSKRPRVSIPIDKADPELETWAQSLRYEVEIHEIVRYRNRETDAFMIQLPDIGSAPLIGGDQERSNNEHHALMGKELLLKLVGSGFIQQGEKLWMKHKGKEFSATVTASGQLELPDGTKHSPSLAAIRCTQSISPNRKTSNGLRKWKNDKGETLGEMRMRLFGKDDDSEAA